MLALPPDAVEEYARFAAQREDTMQAARAGEGGRRDAAAAEKKKEKKISGTPFMHNSRAVRCDARLR